MYKLTNTLPPVSPQYARRKLGNQLTEVMVPQFTGTSQDGIKSIVLDKDRALKSVYLVDRSQSADKVMSYQVANFEEGDVILRNKWRYDNEGNYFGIYEIIQSDGKRGCAASQASVDKMPLAEIDPIVSTWFAYTAVQSVEEGLYPLESLYEKVQDYKVGTENVAALNTALANIYIYLGDNIMSVDEFALRAIHTRVESLQSQWFNAMSIFANLSYDFKPVYGDSTTYVVLYVLVDAEDNTTVVRESDEEKPLLHTAKRVLRLTYFHDMSAYNGATDVALNWRIYKA